MERSNTLTETTSPSRETGEYAGGTASDGEPVTRADMFEMLSNHRRRYALYALKRRDGGPASASNIAERVAA